MDPQLPFRLIATVSQSLISFHLPSLNTPQPAYTLLKRSFRSNQIPITPSALRPNDVFRWGRISTHRRLIFRLTLILLVSSSVYAFIPTRLYSGYGIFGIPHTAQTEYAINLIISDEFGLNPDDLITSMAQAREEIKDACAGVDDPKILPPDVGLSEADIAPAHFDGESFQEGHERIKLLRGLMESALKTGEVGDARKYLGRCLHSIQDFYSHSNWVELERTDTDKTLGRLDVATVYSKTDPLTTTCDDCTYSGVGREYSLLYTETCKKYIFDNYGALLACEKFYAIPALLVPPMCDANLDPAFMATNQLTSGFYGFTGQKESDIFYKKANKCSHGGPRDVTATGIEGIAKDTTSEYISPHSKWHPNAAAIAKQATHEFLQDINAQLCTDTKVRDCVLAQLLYGFGPSLAFAIDTTGSMGSIISSVRDQAIQIVNHHRGTFDQPSLYVLSPFNDPSTGPITTTSDADKFIQAINALGASGGGDCPELAMAGLLGAVKNSAEGGNVFLWTDAGAKDLDLVPDVITAATKRNIHVYNFLFPSSCQSGAGFEDVALASGGLTFYASSTAEAPLMIAFADMRIKSNALSLGLYEKSTNPLEGIPFRFASRAPTDVSLYDIPVDSGMTDLQLALSGTGAVLTLSRPDGSDALADKSNATNVIKLTNGLLVDIVNPIVGLWKASVTSSGNFSFQVLGAGGMHITNCRYVEIRGSAHEGLFPVDLDPEAGSDAILMCNLNGLYKTATFEFHKSDGTFLSTADLTAAADDDGVTPSKTLFGNVTVPDVSYVIYVTGQLETGETYTRVYPRVFVIPEGGHTNHTPTSASSAVFPYPTDYHSSTPSSLPYSSGPQSSPYNFPRSSLVSMAACKDCDIPSSYHSFTSSHPYSSVPQSSPHSFPRSSPVSMATCEDRDNHNYPPTPCPPPPELITTTRVITVYKPCHVTECHDICRTSISVTEEIVTTTHLALSKGGSHTQEDTDSEIQLDRDAPAIPSGFVYTCPSPYVNITPYTDAATAMVQPSGLPSPPTDSLKPNPTTAGEMGNGTKPTASPSIVVLKGASLKNSPNSVVAFAVCLALAMLGWIHLI